MADTTDLGTSAGQAPVAPVIDPVAEPIVAPQTVVAPQPAPVTSLPENAPNRTREQFEKLVESNRRLYEDKLQLERELAARRAPDYGTPQRQSTQQVNPNDFVEIDPLTGDKFINEQRLRSKLEEVNSKTQQLEQVVNSYVKSAEEREIDRQEKETYSAHPELNPNSQTFDPVFNRNVRSILTDSFYNQEEYGGRPLSFKEAADFVKAQFQPKQVAQATAEQQAQIDAQVAQQSAAAQAQKEQGSAQAVSQPRGQAAITDDEQLENLRYRTRYLNDDWALAQRIVNTDHVAKDVEEVA